MSQTNFIAFRGGGFWAYDVAKAVFLKFLIDCATDHCQRSAEHSSWLVDAISDWRVEACVSDYGVTISESWSDAKLAVLIRLLHEACTRLAQRQIIPAEEALSWKVLDNEGIGSVRGATEMDTKPVIELGQAIIALINGTLPTPPADTCWLFGTSAEMRTIRMQR